MIKLQSNFIEITLQYMCPPVNLLQSFRTPFPKNTSGRLLLKIITESTGETIEGPEVNTKEVIIQPDCEEFLQIPECDFHLKESLPFFPHFDTTEKKDQLEWCFRRDVAWTCAASFMNQNVNTVNSWTNFNKAIDKSI